MNTLLILPINSLGELMFLKPNNKRFLMSCRELSTKEALIGMPIMLSIVKEREEISRMLFWWWITIQLPIQLFSSKYNNVFTKIDKHAGSINAGLLFVNAWCYGDWKAEVYFRRNILECWLFVERNPLGNHRNRGQAIIWFLLYCRTWVNC